MKNTVIMICCAAALIGCKASEVKPGEVAPSATASDTVPATASASASAAAVVAPSASATVAPAASAVPADKK